MASLPRVQNEYERQLSGSQRPSDLPRKSGFASACDSGKSHDGHPFRLTLIGTNSFMSAFVASTCGTRFFSKWVRDMRVKFPLVFLACERRRAKYFDSGAGVEV